MISMKPDQSRERRWIRYLWLIYLLPAFIPFLFMPKATFWDWAITLVGIGLFIPLYLRAYDHTGNKILPYVAIMSLMGLIFTQFNPNLSSIFIYAAAAAARVGDSRKAWQVVFAIATVVLVAAGISVLREGWYVEVFYFAFFLFFVVFIGAINIFSTEREGYNQKLLAARAENERLAAIAERERIARDLHDLLGHTLAVITLKAELATKLAERDPTRAKAEMLEVERISREATQQVREAVQGYKSRGLLGELASAKLAFESAGIQFDYYAEAVELSPMQESVLSLSLREAVTNVLRHSSATHCAVRLLKDAEGIRLEVEDNGKGGGVTPGSGLTGMRQRVEALGGHLEANGTNGFRLSILLPVAASSPSAFPTELKTQTS